MATHEWAFRFNERLRELGINADGVNFVMWPGKYYFYAYGANGRTFFSMSDAPGHDRELGWGRWSSRALVDIPIDPDDLTSADAVAADVAAALHAGDYCDLGPPRADP